MFTLTVLSARADEFRAELDKLNRKAARYGAGRIEYRAAGERTEVVRDAEGRKHHVQLTDFEFEGDPTETPRVGDYSFIASLELVDGGCIVDHVPAAVVDPKFRQWDGTCEHCGKQRDRRHLFVVQEAGGAQMAVGRSCLRDYMGTDTPEGLSWRFRWLREARALSEGYGSLGDFSDSVATVLAVTHAAVRLWGWVPNIAPESAGMPTVARVGHYFWCHPEDLAAQQDARELRAALGDADWEAAGAAYAWLMDQPADSDYIHNLQLVCGSGYVEPRRRGLVCSLIGAWRREELRREREAAAAAKEAAEPSKWIGRVGERLRGLDLTVEDIRGYEGSYGYVTIYKMRDDQGNRFCWFCSGAGLDRNQGDRVRLDATVKGHSEYQGAKETQLTRGRLV